MKAPATPAFPLPAGLALRASGVRKQFGAGTGVTVALDGADFDAELGEITMIVGPSGCGKTTLLSIIAGTLTADAGRIEVLGSVLNELPRGALTRFRARNVGFIFQQFNLIPTISVAENVSVPLLIRGVPRRQAETQAMAILERVGMAARGRERPLSLSGGQQQRIAIARALIHSPALLICDEPTSALDRDTGHQVMEIIRDVARDPGRCVIVVTHDPRIYRYADRMAEMEDGKVLRVLTSPAAIATAHPPS